MEHSEGDFPHARRTGSDDGVAEAQARALSAVGSHAVRSARRLSLENISTMRLVDADALLQPLDLELLVPQHEGDDQARPRRPGRCGPSGAGRPCGPRAGRSG